MYGDIFSRIKSTLSMANVVEQYGFEVNQSGDMLCPFHNDSKPSLHVYPGNRGWYCFVCDEGGTVIDFVAKLFHLNARQAAIRLDNDFRLGLSMEKPDRCAENQWMEQRHHEQAELAAYRAEYDAKCREAYTIRTAPKPPPDSPLWGKYAVLLGWLDYLDNYWFENNKWR